MTTLAPIHKEPLAKRLLGWPPLVADLFSGETYRVGLYLLLLLPVSTVLCLLWGSLLTVGLSTLPILVGLLFLALLLPGLLAANAVQRWLAGLHGVRAGRAAPAPGGGLKQWAAFQLGQPSLWHGALFQLVAWPLALLCWVLLGAALGVTAFAALCALSPLLGVTPALGAHPVPGRSGAGRHSVQRGPAAADGPWLAGAGPVSAAL